MSAGSGGTPDVAAPPRVVIIGDVFVDLSAKVKGLPQWDSDTEAEYIKAQPGGSALNQARQLHSIGGAEVRFLGAIGDDAFGKMLMSHVQGQGFPLERVKVYRDLPSSVCIVLAGPSDRAFVSCYSTTDAFCTADVEDRAEAFEGSRHLHIGGYFNLKGLQNPAFTAVVQRCRERGMTVSLNTQYDAGEKWTGEGGHLAELLPLTDLLFVNEAEAERIAAKSPGAPAGAAGPEALCGAHPGLTVVMTRGGEGVDVVRAGAERVRVATVPAKPVDATGAGDAFLAGYLSSWLAGDSQEAACARGHAVARVCVGREGACVEPVRPADLQ